MACSIASSPCKMSTVMIDSVEPSNLWTGSSSTKTTLYDVKGYEPYSAVKNVIAGRRAVVEEANHDSCPGRQNAYMVGCEDADEVSSAKLSGGMVKMWNGPAAHAICWTDVREVCEKVKIVLCELYGCAT